MMLFNAKENFTQMLPHLYQNLLTVNAYAIQCHVFLGLEQARLVMRMRIQFPLALSLQATPFKATAG